MPRKIEISHRTIIFTAVFAAGLWLLFTIREILLQMFVALLITTVLGPTVARLSRLKIPKGLSLVAIYLLFFSLLALVLGLIINPLIRETTDFATSLPSYIQQINLPIIKDELASEATKALGSLPGQIIKFGVSLFSNAITVLTVFIFAFYFILARDRLEDQFVKLFGEKRGEKIASAILTLELRLGGWARGQLILMVIVGVATYIGLIILGIPFALPLALLAGILEIIPNLGPILASVPAILVGFSISLWTGLGAAALSFLINQLENYILVPKIMEKSAGVNPILTLFSIIIGFEIAGAAGAILAVPTVIMLQVIGDEFLLKK